MKTSIVRIGLLCLVIGVSSLSVAQAMNMEEVRAVLNAHPPGKGSESLRDEAFMNLDVYLMRPDANINSDLWGFYNKQINGLAGEIAEPVPAGARIWQMYNHGFIVKTPSSTMAFDLVDAPWSVWPNSARLPDAVLRQIDVVFVSHEHPDHYGRPARRIGQLGGTVIGPPPGFPAGTEADIRGLKVKAYYGAHSVPNNIYHVTTPEGLTIMHTGDTQRSYDLPSYVATEILLINSWMNESGSQSSTEGLRTAIKRIRPSLTIPGHIHEIQHVYLWGYTTGPFYEQALSVDDVSIPGEYSVMAWGESYAYNIPDTHYVDVNNDSPEYPYETWATAANDIQTAVNAASSGDTVLVADGTYAITSQIDVTKCLTVRSVNGPEVTKIDAGGNCRVFNLNSNKGSVKLEGFSISNGYTLSNGGGISAAGSGSIEIVDCILENNETTANGGGVSCQNTNVVLEKCIVQFNHANRNGGGVFRGIIKNSVVCKNRSNWIGGGVNRSIAINCTITQNRADHIAGGVAFGSTHNCIVWDNQGLQLYSADLFNSCCPEVVHGVDGNITNAPVLTSSSHISSDSPCRGAGAFADASGTDIDGDPWLNPPSMGCDEYISGGVLPGAIHVGFEEGSLMVETNDALPMAGTIHGAVSQHVWDFGDGESATNQLSLVHSWSSPGSYDVVLTAFNDSNPGGVSATQTITVVDAAGTPVLYVSTTGNDSNDGLSWINAKATIPAGVDAQPMEGGVVLLAAGIYSITNTVIVEHGITVEGVDGAAGTVVDGGGIVQCFQLFSGGRLKGLSIRNGKTTGIKGGPGEHTVVEDCLVYENVGDGLYGTTVYNCSVTNNAGRGMNDCTAYYCLVANNVGGKAGGMEMSFNNGTTNWSGAAYNCVITNNTAEFGGGVSGGAAFNCLIAGNHATDYGGGAADTLAINCTIVGNTAVNRGGGTYKSELYATVSDVNCIVWGNTAPQFPNMQYPVAATHSCSPDLTPGVDGNINADPQFINPFAGDYRLSLTSPCIDMGSNGCMPMATDLGGNPRFMDGDFDGHPFVDMGAYEVQTISVEVDIKPGSDTNPINLKSRGRIPVAVLGSAEFDVAEINFDSIRFAGAAPVYHAYEDVDSDGDADFILHFNTQELRLRHDSTLALLLGQTHAGELLGGSGRIRIVPDK